MLLELAIADAYGFGFEYAPSDFVARHNRGEVFVQHPGRPDIIPGRYSDDTQMSVALAEFMLSGEPMTAVNLVGYFIDAFKRDPREGYAGRFYDILVKVRNPQDFLSVVQPQSNRSGGAMRASTCGLLASTDDVINAAVWQASVTHATRDGMNAAAASALLVWACRQGIDQGFLPQFLNDTVPGYQWDIPWIGPVGAPGIHAVKAALDALANETTLHDVLVHSVAFTGDVDTVAAISLAAASQHPDIVKNLAPELYDGLEDGKYGKKYITKLDARLTKRFPI